MELVPSQPKTWRFLGLLFQILKNTALPQRKVAEHWPMGCGLSSNSREEQTSEA